MFPNEYIWEHNLNQFCIFQFEINRKRDTELTKLRKLLEDVHLESEETAHLLKKKHQEIVVDFQDQIDKLTHSKSRWGILTNIVTT